MSPWRSPSPLAAWVPSQSEGFGSQHLCGPGSAFCLLPPPHPSPQCRGSLRALSEAGPSPSVQKSGQKVASEAATVLGEEAHDRWESLGAPQLWFYGRDLLGFSCAFSFFLSFFLFFFFFGLYRAVHAAYGGSQGIGRIGAAAASLHHSHSHPRSLTH